MVQSSRIPLLAAFIAVLVVVFLGAAQAQVAVYGTHFSTVTMPSQVGQQVLLGSLPLGTSTQGGLASFDFQAAGSFQGTLTPNPLGILYSFEVYLCDTADCSGATRSQVGHVNLAPFALSYCLNAAVTLRGSFAQASGGAHDAIFTGMLDGLWTGRPLASATCETFSTIWADGLIDNENLIVVGQIGALPSLSKDPVDTTETLFLVLMTTVTENQLNEQGTGQMSLMRAVVYPH